MLDKFLKIKKSKIPQAGKGVFTKVDFKKGQRICEMLGEIVKVKEYNKRLKDFSTKEGYAVEITSRRYLDTWNHECFGKYINDAYKSSFKNNTVLCIDENEIIYIEALCKIKKGEELFLSYGKDYWNKILLKP